MAVGPDPRVMDEPATRVWPETMYSEWAFGVMVASLMVMGTGAIGGAVGKVRREVVRMLEPAALVVGRMIAGRWIVDERMVPCALVEVMIVGRDAEIEAVERLVERTMLP